MKSYRSAKFDELYAQLPEEIQKQAIKAYKIFEENPYHPGLRFKPINDSVYSVRVGIGYRAVGKKDNDTIVWYWIGSHADYDKMC